MSDTLKAARIVAYTGAIVYTAQDAFSSSQYWAIGVTFGGIVLVEFLVNLYEAWQYFRSRIYQSLVDDTAAKVLVLIQEEREREIWREAIASFRGGLPDDLVDAAESGRLDMTVKD